MRSIVEGNHSRLEFDSVADLLGTVRNYRDVPLYVRHLGSRRDSFFGSDVRSLEDIYTLARDGWAEQLPQTLAIAEETVNTIDREYDLPMWRSYYDVAGADVDVARYLAGEPENMVAYTMVETPGTGRVVSIAMNIGASASVSTRDMVRRGRAVVALVLALENLGIRVELYTDAQSEGDYRNGGYITAREIVKVKDSTDALDPAHIMFALAHPAFYRGMVLASRHAHPKRVQEGIGVGDGYGSIADDLPREVFPEGTLFLDTALVSESGKDLGDVKAFVVKQFANLALI